MEALKPCPFCGGPAEVIHLEGGENDGGSCVSCTSCFASSPVEFGFKENFVDNWNRRSDHSPALLEALKRLWPDNLGVVPDHLPDDFVFPIDFTAGELRRVAAAISQAEGGE